MFFCVIRRALTKNSKIRIQLVTHWFLRYLLFFGVKPKKNSIKTTQKFAQNKICIKFALA
jgi:hypothetical protein